MIFCDVFIDRFHPVNVALIKRLAQSNAQLKELALKHSAGRDSETLPPLEKELEAVRRLNDSANGSRGH